MHFLVIGCCYPWAFPCVSRGFGCIWFGKEGVPRWQTCVHSPGSYTSPLNACNTAYVVTLRSRWLGFLFGVLTRALRRVALTSNQITGNLPVPDRYSTGERLPLEQGNIISEVDVHWLTYVV